MSELEKGVRTLFPQKGPDPFSRLRLAAALGLALLLVVVLAAAAIRLGWAFGWVRAIHRVAASLEVLVVLWLAWLAWRRTAVQIALALTAALSAIGIAAGQEPPPAAATANLLGGLALTATFAWILGRAEKPGKSGSDPSRENRGLTPIFLIFLLLAVQLGLGAWLSLVERSGVALPAHGLLAVALTALLVWAARTRSVLLVLALAAPLAGFTALHYEYSAAAALVHAAAAALLVAASAYAFGRAA